VSTGGSEASATWKKMPVNKDARNTAGDVVNSERRTVYTKAKLKSGHRKSRHCDAVPLINENDKGK
jgi:hypothetical protein